MSFTLTMWDVKIFFCIKRSLNKFCFTLTMWDVKASPAMSRCGSLICFTLTMWDVKVFEIYTRGDKAKKFYLNYVGCKEIYQNFC